MIAQAPNDEEKTMLCFYSHRFANEADRGNFPISRDIRLIGIFFPFFWRA